MKTKITFQNRLYQDKKKKKKKKKKKNDPGTLFIFVFLTLYLLSQLSGIFLNDVRANIKIKKKRKINLLAPLPCWVLELQRWKKGKGGERKRRVACRRGIGVGGEDEGEGTRSVRR